MKPAPRHWNSWRSGVQRQRSCPNTGQGDKASWTNPIAPPHSPSNSDMKNTGSVGTLSEKKNGF